MFHKDINLGLAKYEVLPNTWLSQSHSESTKIFLVCHEKEHNKEWMYFITAHQVYNIMQYYSSKDSVMDFTTEYHDTLILYFLSISKLSVQIQKQRYLFIIIRTRTKQTNHHRIISHFRIWFHGFHACIFYVFYLPANIYPSV